MGNSNSAPKPEKTPASPLHASLATPAHAPNASVAIGKLEKETKQGDKTLATDMDKYTALRDDLLSFSLGEASYDYAARLLKEQPENPAIMALYGETIWLYEKLKNPTRKEHWCDRLDLLQLGINATKKCMKDHPEYAPCWRVYTLIAVKMADQENFYKWTQPLGVMRHYKRIMKRGQHGLEMQETGDLCMALAELAGRVGTTNTWYKPYRMFGKYHGNPTREECLETARDLHLRAARIDPEGLENAARLGMTYLELGDLNEARRWYTKARDVLTPRTPKDDIWQTVAHTHLTTQFSKKKWNVPLG